MKLTTGDIAPTFMLTDFTGNTVSLLKYKKKKVLLSFFRGASCPFCNLRVHELIKKHSEFENAGLEIITFFTADANEIQQYAGKQFPSFSVIPDPNLSVYKKYGIESSVAGMFKAMLRAETMIKIMTGGFFNLNSMADKPILPADFLIDENGKIYQAYYGKDYGDHINLNQVKKWLGIKS